MWIKCDRCDGEGLVRYRTDIGNCVEGCSKCGGDGGWGSSFDEDDDDE